MCRVETKHAKPGTAAGASVRAACSYASDVLVGDACLCRNYFPAKQHDVRSVVCGRQLSGGGPPVEHRRYLHAGRGGSGHDFDGVRKREVDRGIWESARVRRQWSAEFPGHQSVVCQYWFGMDGLPSADPSRSQCAGTLVSNHRPTPWRSNAGLGSQPPVRFRIRRGGPGRRSCGHQFDPDRDLYGPRLVYPGAV